MESLSWMAPSLPSTRMVLLPAFTAMPVLTVTPVPVSETAPDVVLMLWPTVKPVEASSDTVPELVVRLPGYRLGFESARA